MLIGPVGPCLKGVKSGLIVKEREKAVVISSEICVYG